MIVMSQKEVYKIIAELTGEATYKQIKQRAKEKFPQLSLHQYVKNRLRKLEKKGYVTHYQDEERNEVWKIIKEWP